MECGFSNTRKEDNEKIIKNKGKEVPKKIIVHRKGYREGHRNRIVVGWKSALGVMRTSNTY